MNIHSAPQTLQRPKRTVIGYMTGRHTAKAHEEATFHEIGRRLAALLAADYAHPSDTHDLSTGGFYVVPDDTISTMLAKQLGIVSADDLFGGAVPFPFCATKSITHPLVDTRAVAPEGWDTGLAGRIAPVVHRGYSAFSASDAHRAGLALLGGGPIRLKPSRLRGGGGQIVVEDAKALTAAIDRFDTSDITETGLIVEENLRNVVTVSVGTVDLAGRSIAYIGKQHMKPNNAGHLVYGGSDLVVYQGGLSSLLEKELDRAARLAVTQAIAYDTAAHQAFPQLIASRRNYDVAQGLDASGAWRSGVLEQSWRLGGATTAEIAAFEAFAKDPAKDAVKTRAVEQYGANAEIPPHAAIYFDAVDSTVGRLVKYAVIDP